MHAFSRSHVTCMLVVVALAVVLGSALAPNPVAARDTGQVDVQHTGAGWQAQYFANLSVSPPAAVVRTDSAIDFDWGGGSPDPARLPSNNFSARWQQYLDLAAGRYRFSARSDDGVRVRVDGQLIINRWNQQPATSVSAEIDLDSGHHLVVVEYFEAQGDAMIYFEWAPVTSAPTGFLAEYYANRDLAGSPAVTRDDSAIDFAWGSNAPAPGVPADNFSVRWTARLPLSAGTYSFSTTTDDGVRLWINGHLLINQWHDQAVTTHSGRIYVDGPADVRMEYYERTGNARARLTWDAVGARPTAPPTGTHVVQRGDTLFSIARRYGVTVDAIRRANGITSDFIYIGQRLVIPGATVPATPAPSGDVVVETSDSGFRRGGSATAWRTAQVGHNGSMLWTLNNDVRHANYNWARWYPSLTAGRYEVFAFIPRLNANTHRATYWIAHADGFSSRTVDQAAYSDAWVSLGTYRFVGSGEEYASLNDITGEPRLSRRIGFDAVRFSRR